MPIYEYTCEQCHAIVELLRKASDADAALTCEACGSTKLTRRHSTFAARSGSNRDVPLPTAGPGCACGNPHGPCNTG